MIWFAVDMRHDIVKYSDEKPLDAIIDGIANSFPDSVQRMQFEAELARLEMTTKLEALEAQKVAAIAQQKAANASFWSVIVASASVVLAAIGVVATITGWH